VNAHEREAGGWDGAMRTLLDDYEAHRIDPNWKGPADVCEWTPKQRAQTGVNELPNALWGVAMMVAMHGSLNRFAAASDAHFRSLFELMLACARRATEEETFWYRSMLLNSRVHTGHSMLEVLSENAYLVESLLSRPEIDVVSPDPKSMRLPLRKPSRWLPLRDVLGDPCCIHSILLSGGHYSLARLAWARLEPDHRKLVLSRVRHLAELACREPVLCAAYLREIEDDLRNGITDSAKTQFRLSLCRWGATQYTASTLTMLLCHGPSWWEERFPLCAQFMFRAENVHMVVTPQSRPRDTISPLMALLLLESLKQKDERSDRRRARLVGQLSDEHLNRIGPNGMSPVTYVLTRSSPQPFEETLRALFSRGTALDLDFACYASSFATASAPLDTFAPVGPLHGLEVHVKNAVITGDYLAHITWRERVYVPQVVDIARAELTRHGMASVLIDVCLAYLGATPQLDSAPTVLPPSSTMQAPAKRQRIA